MLSLRQALNRRCEGEAIKDISSPPLFLRHRNRVFFSHGGERIGRRDGGREDEGEGCEDEWGGSGAREVLGATIQQNAEEREEEGRGYGGDLRFQELEAAETWVVSTIKYYLQITA
ncbi:hypothetical protein Vadar_014666 [Vaccinium darrowii]|uniref:Uncharacterized protein n=1 Tax=Vaccinium darrowii TaxID=229202 RepID=A0ACB7Z5E1_9ERIC|nr:hypothetical protein Vadar_014666 [Vaccinium darrowii]